MTERWAMIEIKIHTDSTLERCYSKQSAVYYAQYLASRGIPVVSITAEVEGNSFYSTSLVDLGAWIDQIASYASPESRSIFYGHSCTDTYIPPDAILLNGIHIGTTDISKNSLEQLCARFNAINEGGVTVRVISYSSIGSYRQVHTHTIETFRYFIGKGNAVEKSEQDLMYLVSIIGINRVRELLKDYK